LEIRKAMQQLPPFPEDTPEPSQPAQPSEAPSEAPVETPDVDVPAPSTPGTQPSPTPISPVA
jgi:hypothetical protein